MITIELTRDPDVGGYTARVPNIPAYGEGRTEDQAIADLREALAGYVETFGIDDACAHISDRITVRRIDETLDDFLHGLMARPGS